MTRAEYAYAAWAPAGLKWSAWAKPALFADMPFVVDPPPPGALPPTDWLGRERGAALVVDLPGVASVLLGLALAQAGFQPVPLYNAGSELGELVDMRRIALELEPGANLLRPLPRREDAMPAFLMNSDRLDNGGLRDTPGRYDNRWTVVPQDMPSADFLKTAGVRKVILVSDRVRDDLAHILLRYQTGGIEIWQTPDGVSTPSRVTVAAPSRFRELGYRLAVFAGLRRNSAGGFGAVVPDPASSGGSGFA